MLRLKDMAKFVAVRLPELVADSERNVIRSSISSDQAAHE